MTIVFKGLPEKASSNSYDDIRRLSSGLLSGKMNVAGKFDVAINTSQTIVNDRNIGENSFIGFIGLDENSLTEKLYIKSRDVLGKTFTVGHDASSSKARKYSYVVIG